ncbi:uncharacterized protein LOC134704857 isoform X2 [Mytilus trossulus]
MNIVDEDDVKMKQLKENDGSSTDFHSGLLEEVYTQNHRRYRKRMLIVILIILVIAAASAVGIVVGKASDSSNTETKPKTKKIKGDETGITNNVIKIEGNDTKLSKSGDRVISCLFHDMSDKNVNPFIDTCKIGSQEVNDTCNKSPHSCKDCCEDCRMILPIICFCDEVLHCPDNNSDRPAKMEYDKCKGDYCPCRNGGNCSSKVSPKRATAKDIICSCPKGFSGHYCQHKPNRICEEQLSTSMLKTKNCSKKYDAKNNDAKCHISQNNTIFICKIPKDPSETHNIPNCTDG